MSADGYPRVERSSARWALTTLFGVLALLVLVPVIYVVGTSVRPLADIQASPLGLPTSPVLDALSEVWNRSGMPRSIVNSTLISAGSAITMGICASMAAYAFVFAPFRGARAVFLVIIAGSMLPAQAILYPLFTQLLNAGLINTFPGVILAQSSFGLPLTTFAFAAYFRSLPGELVEAAAIDGASSLRTLVHVILPMSGPIVATTGILNFVWTWNDLLLPLIILQDQENQTLIQTLSLLPGQAGIDENVLAATAVIGMVPLIGLFLIAQRRIVAGMTAGAVKG